MQFELTDDQSMLQQTVARYASERIAPHAGGWDKAAAFDTSLRDELAEMGLFGVLVPTESGGAGLGATELALAVRTLARADPAVALGVVIHNALVCAHIQAAGDADQKASWLPRLAAGTPAAWAMPEAAADAPDAVACVATNTGGGWQLEGTAPTVFGGRDAELIVVLAQTAGVRANRAFLVDPQAAGVQLEDAGAPLGMRALSVARLELQGLALSNQAVLGGAGTTDDHVDALWDGAHVQMAALAVGLGEGALDVAGRFALDRRQFGRRIADFQAIQWKLATMHTQLESSWQLTLRAAWMLDNARRCPKEAAMARLMAAGAAVTAADEALQIHGGVGFTTEFAPEKYYRDAQYCRIGFGSDAALRSRIARAALSEVSH